MFNLIHKKINSLNPKTLGDFYQFAIHLIYAVIIGQSFLLASSVFVPIDKIFNFSGFENGYALFLAYVVAVTGWVGWARSIVKSPHSENALGNFRFITDLVIMFLYYYLLSLADPATINRYGDTFVWVFPSIFGAYIAWDVLKYFEYKCDVQKAIRDRKKRLLISVYFFIAFTIQSIIFQYVTQNQQFLNWDGNSLWLEVFISSSFVLTITYRWLKWKIPVARRRMRKRRSNKTNPSS